MSNPLYREVYQFYGVITHNAEIRKYIRTLDKSAIHDYGKDKWVTKGIDFIHSDEAKEMELVSMMDIGQLEIKLPGTDRVMYYQRDNTYTSAKGKCGCEAFGLVYWSNEIKPYKLTITEDFEQNPEVIAKFRAYIQEKFGRKPKEFFVHE